MGFKALTREEMPWLRLKYLKTLKTLKALTREEIPCHRLKHLKTLKTLKIEQLKRLKRLRKQRLPETLPTLKTLKKLKTEEILKKHTPPENWSNWGNTIQRASL